MASILYVGHATTLIELDGVRLLTDPLLRTHVGHLKRLVPLGEAPAPPDAVLLSHLHGDHLDLPSLRRLGQRTRLFVPRGGGGLLRRQGFLGVEELSEGETAYVSGVEIRAVPALHDGRRYPVGKQIAALGYALAGSRTLYFAGDTDFFEGMRELAGLDAALLPIAGWGARLGPGHLDPAGAAEALRVLRPRLAIPIHWGTYAPWHWRLTRHETPSREPEVAFAEAAALAAPDVEVRILRPGERTAF